MEEMKKRFSAGPVTFAVRHELWDGNIQDHPDQGVAILVVADVADKETTLLRFNCFDFERSYVYGPENADLRVDGPAMLGGAAATNLYRMDSTVDGNPIGWTIRTLDTKLPKMLRRAGYPQIAETVDMAEVSNVLLDVEACARELRATRPSPVPAWRALLSDSRVAIRSTRHRPLESNTERTRGVPCPPKTPSRYPRRAMTGRSKSGLAPSSALPILGFGF